MSNARVNEAEARARAAEAEVERLRQQKTDLGAVVSQDLMDEVVRLRSEHEEMRVLSNENLAEVVRLRTNIDIWQKTAEDALDEAGRLRAALKSEKEGEVCYGDFAGECYRVGRVPCSECEAWIRRP